MECHTPGLRQQDHGDQGCASRTTETDQGSEDAAFLHHRTGVDLTSSGLQSRRAVLAPSWPKGVGDRSKAPGMEGWVERESGPALKLKPGSVLLLEII